MTYICMRCGNHFEEIDRKHYDNSTGVWEEYCPNCGSEDFEEARHCIKCDEWFPIDDTNKPDNYMIGSICKDCLTKRMTVDNAFRYGNARKVVPEEGLNSFIYHSWSRYNAENELVKSCTPEDARRFISDDLYDFSEWLEGQND